MKVFLELMASTVRSQASSGGLHARWGRRKNTETASCGYSGERAVLTSQTMSVLWEMPTRA
jgi:hypothetical protein